MNSRTELIKQRDSVKERLTLLEQIRTPEGWRLRRRGRKILKRVEERIVQCDQFLRQIEQFEQETVEFLNEIDEPGLVEEFMAPVPFEDDPVHRIDLRTARLDKIIERLRRKVSRMR